jgi:FlaA1/EpsC-like NDP-sugar epimerase
LIPAQLRAIFAFTHDMVAAALAWCLAYLLRFNLEIPAYFLSGMLRTLAWLVPLQAVVFWRLGLYRGMWRYASLPDLQRIVLAVAVSVMGVAVVLVLLQAWELVPRSVLLSYPFLLVVIMGGSRLAYRAWKEHRLYGLSHRQGRPVLMLGAGDTAVTLLKELERGQEWQVVGLLDDDPGTHGRLLLNVKVLGAIDRLPEFARELGVGHAIIAMPSATHTVRRRATGICISAGVKVMTVPSFDDLVSGKVTVSSIREIELDDLLGRDPVALDSAGLSGLLRDRTIMVSGAGGSIGSELCRQIARFAPRKLVFFELNEFALYSLEQEFQQHLPGLPVVCAIGDVKDPARVAQLMHEHQPDVVFHAAAYKHVPLMESGNVWQAALNNVGGTCVMARAAAAQGVRRFVLISTDKAVNPTSVMGATKRLAEMVCLAHQQRTSTTQFVMVRFGNVLGSAGSVIPKFREQIARGGPVTVTHPEISRYFMSIPEASQLVLQSALMGTGGEIFVLDMGESVKIVDLARELIRLSGFPEDEIRIVFTGLRPGEKLREELLAQDERTVATRHPKLRIAQARSVPEGFLEDIAAWLAEPSPDEVEIRRSLRRWVPEYAASVPGPTAAIRI